MRVTIPSFELSTSDTPHKQPRLDPAIVSDLQEEFLR